MAQDDGAKGNDCVEAETNNALPRRPYPPDVINLLNKTAWAERSRMLASAVAIPEVAAQLSEYVGAALAPVRSAGSEKERLQALRNMRPIEADIPSLVTRAFDQTRAAGKQAVSDRQRRAAASPRVRLANGEPLVGLIAAITNDPANAGKSGDVLWRDHFLPALAKLGPFRDLAKEVGGTSTPDAVEYGTKNGRMRRISKSTFMNHVSSSREKSR